MRKLKKKEKVALIIVLLLIAIGIFAGVYITSEQKKAKEEKARVEELKNGMEELLVQASSMSSSEINDLVASNEILEEYKGKFDELIESKVKEEEALAKEEEKKEDKIEEEEVQSGNNNNNNSNSKPSTGDNTSDSSSNNNNNNNSKPDEEKPKPPVTGMSFEEFAKRLPGMGYDENGAYWEDEMIMGVVNADSTSAGFALENNSPKFDSLIKECLNMLLPTGGNKVYDIICNQFKNQVLELDGRRVEIKLFPQGVSISIYNL